MFVWWRRKIHSCVCSLQTWPASFLEIMRWTLRWPLGLALLPQKGGIMSQFFVQLNLLCSARDGCISQQMRSPRCRCDNEQEVRNKLLNFVATNVFLAQQKNNYIITRKCQHFSLMFWNWKWYIWNFVLKALLNVFFRDRRISKWPSVVCCSAK